MIYILVLVLCVAADQALKLWTVANLGLYESAPLIPGIVELRYIQNTGGGFSILTGYTWLLAAVTAVLNALGADIEELPDGLVIHGKDGLAGGVTVDSFNDHRIAMMTAVAATRCAAPVTLLGADCVKKSYPNFWEDYEQLGGEINRTD